MLNKNALVEKLTSRFFRKVEDAVWDMTTGSIGIKQGDSVFTMTGKDANDAQVSEDMLAMFSLPVPAFAQPLPLEQINFGDIIYGDKGALGWVIKKTAKTVAVMNKQGVTSTITPRKVAMFGANGNTMMVLRSLVAMSGGTTEAFGGIQQSMLPMLMLMGDKADGDLLSTMLMMQFMGGQPGANAAAMNPMMMMLMLGKGKDFFG